MRNAIAPLSLLAASIIALGGCDGRVASDQSLRPSSAVSESNVRYQVDAAHGRIWWLTREGVFLRDARTPQRIAVPIPGWQWAGEPYGCLPALALGPNGEALVTSDVESTVWKIDPETLAVSMHVLAPDADLDKDVGYTALTYSSEHGAFFAEAVSTAPCGRSIHRSRRRRRSRSRRPCPRPAASRSAPRRRRSGSAACASGDGEATGPCSSLRISAPPPCAPRRAPICPGC